MFSYMRRSPRRIDIAASGVVFLPASGAVVPPAKYAPAVKSIS
ncbi:hypothetical protein [Selenomonas ruminantium]|nr:hypothetical protein [Selenomonas ruminantium]